MAILTEQIGSIPRPASLLQAMVTFQAGDLGKAEMDAGFPHLRWRGSHAG